MGESGYMRFGRQLSQDSEAGPKGVVVPVYKGVIRDAREAPVAGDQSQ